MKRYRKRRNAKEVFRMKKVLGLILAAVMLLSALPAVSIAEEPETTATVTEVNEKGQKGTIVNCKTAVNVRAKASSKSKSLGKAKKGETFTVKGASGNWIKIDFNGKDGYVFKRYISVKGTPDDTPVEGKTGRIINCKTAANVRAKASSKSKLLGTAKRGKTFKVLATAGSWVKIQYNKETAGYVYKKYIHIQHASEPDMLRARLKTVAQQFDKNAEEIKAARTELKVEQAHAKEMKKSLADAAKMAAALKKLYGKEESELKSMQSVVEKQQKGISKKKELNN